MLRERLTVGRGAKVTRARRHDADEVFDVADVVERAIEGGAEPLVRIEDERVGAFDAVPQPAALGQDHRGTGHGGVDVKPQLVARSDVGDGRDRIERRRHGGAGGGDNGARPPSLGDVLLYQVIETIGPHGEGIVVRYDADVVAAEARQERGLFDRAVAL